MSKKGSDAMLDRRRQTESGKSDDIKKAPRLVMMQKTRIRIKVVFYFPDLTEHLVLILVWRSFRIVVRLAGECAVGMKLLAAHARRSFGRVILCKCRTIVGDCA
jgi:hypothetical protein